MNSEKAESFSNWIRGSWYHRLFTLVIITPIVTQSHRERKSLKDLRAKLKKIKVLAKKQRKQIQRMSILFDTEEFNEWISNCFIELNKTAGLPEIILDEGGEKK